MTDGRNDDGANWLTQILSNRPLVVGALFLGSFVVPFLVLIGLVLAYVFRKNPENEWESSHFQYLVRTFWITVGLAFAILVLIIIMIAVIDRQGLSMNDGGILFFILSSLIFIMVPLLVFFGIRVVLSLVRSAAHKPMPNPKSWLL